MPLKRSILLALIAAPLAATTAFAAPPQAFLHDAGMANVNEIALGGLAQRSAQSPQVRDFGRMLQMDHRKASDMAAPLMRRYHVAPPVGIAPEAQMEMRKLQHLSGRAFDREFASFMAMGHEKVIAKFEAQAHGPDRPTADFARQQLPTLHAHLRTARSLAR